MEEDKLSFLDESPVEKTEAPAVEAPAEIEQAKVETTEAPVTGSPVRDDQGRFASKEGKGEVGAPPAPEPKESEGRLTALLDERDKRQAAERRADEAQRKLDEFARQMRPKEAPVVPDVVADPEGFQAHLLRQQYEALDEQEARFSERFARKEFGDEAVKAALEAARTSGAVQQFTAGPDRWERMVKWHQQQMVIQEVGSDPVAYRTKLREEIAAELREQIKAEMTASAPSRPSVPPPSLATAPSTGSHPPGVRGSGFDQAFPPNR